MSESKQYYVYKLFNPNCSEFYIGSTTNIKNRMKCHKYQCNNQNSPKHYNLKVYQYIRSNGGLYNWQYEILEHIRNSINIKELHGVERKYIEQLKPSLNRYIPNRTDAQYYQDNIEEIRTKQSQKHQCPCGGKYTNTNKSQHFKSKKHRAFEQS